MPIHCLFIYGSLGPGRPNEHVMNAIGGSWQVATAKGELREEGWGAELGFPGIRLDENGDEIDGFLFTSEKLVDHWDELDRFEGDVYERVISSVRLADGSQVQAYIYALRGE